MRVQVQRIVHAAIQHLVQHKIHGLQLGQQITLHCDGLAMYKMFRHCLWRQLIDQHRLQIRMPCNHADVGAVAFVAGASVRGTVQRER